MSHANSSIPPSDITSRITERIAADDREGALRVFLVEQVGLPSPAFDQVKASPAWPRMTAMAHTAAYDSEIAADSMLPVESLRKLALPVLVLNGTASFPWIGETARALVRAVPGADAVRLEGQSHSPAPGVLASALAKFFGALP